MLAPWPPTIASALRAALEALAALPSPRSDAEELLSRLLGLTRAGLHLHGARVLTGAEAARFEEWLARRAAHEPVQYITGRAAFRGLDLAVGPGVLVPRPETEGLVEAVLDALRAAPWPAPARARPRHRLGCHRAGDRRRVARRRAHRDRRERHGAGARPRQRGGAGARGPRALRRRPLVRGRWAPASGFEVVVSNPPYIAAGEWEGLPQDVRDFEPREALLAGPRGLDDLRAIATGAPRAPRARRAARARAGRDARGRGRRLVPRSPLWEGVEVRPDLAGRPRCLLARAAGMSRGGRSGA